MFPSSFFLLAPGGARNGRRRRALPGLRAALGEPRLDEHVDVPFHHDAEVGVVEHVFADDALRTVEEFRAEL